ncbi:hypothetical protein Golax_002510, partial [Gossypium laxum]|nr:hypothetical protein [Gossypium laxum]
MGGMFRDADARWLCGFSIAVSKETIFRVEAQAMFEGLRIAWEKGFRQLELECDNTLLVETLLASGAANSSLAILSLVNFLFRRKREKRFRHIPRSQNATANQIAKYVNNGILNMLLFVDPPNSVQEILEFETRSNQMLKASVFLAHASLPSPRPSATFLNLHCPSSSFPISPLLMPLHVPTLSTSRSFTVEALFDLKGGQ